MRALSHHRQWSSDRCNPVRDYPNPEFDPIEQLGRAQTSDLIERGFFVLLAAREKERVFRTGRIAKVGCGIVGQHLVGQPVAGLKWFAGSLISTFGCR